MPSMISIGWSFQRAPQRCNLPTKHQQLVTNAVIDGRIVLFVCL
jgi:hypothetical protein